MIKNTYLFAFVLLLASCGNESSKSTSSPEDAVRNVMNAIIQGDCMAIQANCLDKQSEDIQEWCSDESDFGLDVEKAKAEYGDRFDWEVSRISAEVEFTSPDGSSILTERVILENGSWKMKMH